MFLEYSNTEIGAILALLMVDELFFRDWDCEKHPVFAMIYRFRKLNSFKN